MLFQINAHLNVVYIAPRRSQNSRDWQWDCDGWAGLVLGDNDHLVVKVSPEITCELSAEGEGDRPQYEAR